MNEKVTVKLEGGPETVLWTLHDRASEALRPDGMIRDPKAVQIYQSIDFDYERAFGKPNGGFAMRSLAYDSVISTWMARHPGGTVIEIGCGLETSFWRVDDGKVRWICVDVPEVVTLREQFLPQNERLKHVAKSTADLAWMDEADPTKGVLISAQGVLMYFDETFVRSLVTKSFDRFPDLELVFDAAPRWTSEKSVRENGLKVAPNYRIPPLPWGVNQDDLGPLLRSWSPKIASVEVVRIKSFRGLRGRLWPIMGRLPILRNVIPTMVRVLSSQA